MTYLQTKPYSSRLNCPFTALDSAHPARDVFFFSAEEINQQPVPLKNDRKLFKTGGTTVICRESPENHRNKSSSRTVEDTGFSTKPYVPDRLNHTSYQPVRSGTYNLDTQLTYQKRTQQGLAMSILPLDNSYILNWVYVNIGVPIASNKSLKTLVSSPLNPFLAQDPIRGKSPFTVWSMLSRSPLHGVVVASAKSIPKPRRQEKGA